VVGIVSGTVLFIVYYWVSTRDEVFPSLFELFVASLIGSLPFISASFAARWVAIHWRKPIWLAVLAGIGGALVTLPLWFTIAVTVSCGFFGDCL